MEMSLEDRRPEKRALKEGNSLSLDSLEKWDSQSLSSDLALEVSLAQPIQAIILDLKITINFQLRAKQWIV